MSICRVFSCVVGRGCFLWPVHSFGKTLWAFALLHSVLQGQIYLLLQVSLDFLLLCSSPLWWKGHLFWVLVLEDLCRFACCCCWVTSVVSDSVWPHRRQPTRLSRPWDSPGKNTGVGCYFLLQCMKVKSESEVAQSCLTLSDPMDCSPPGSSIHGFSRQEYWSGVPLPSP